MKILALGYRVPYPVRDGGNARVHGYLRELSRRHEVTYLCRANEPAPEAERYLRTFCRSAEIVVDPFRLTPAARLRSVAGARAFGLITPADPFFRISRERAGRERFDLVYLFGVDTALLALAMGEEAAVVWDLCDCTSRYYVRQVRDVTVPRLRALWYRFQASRYRAVERRLAGRDLAVLVASPSEAEALTAVGGPARARIHVLPTGVEAAPPPAAAPGPPRMAFTGTLAYPPNADAVRHLIREILPRVHRRRPDAHVDIVGSGASGDLLTSGRTASNVSFLGFVPDLYGTLGRMTLFVCPMRQGTGIKVKMLEAMACGLPIVASPLAVEGIPEARDGRHLRIADEPEEFALRIVELLDDGPGRRKLGEGARELAAAYGWQRLGERVDRICREELARRRGD